LISELASKPHVTSIDMNACKIGDAGATKLASVLEKNATLHKLELQMNDITPTGAEKLVDALEKNTTLQSLGLGSNKIGPTGAAKFATLIEKSQTLTYLELASNGIATSGADALTLALQKNIYMKYLGIGFGAGVGSKHNEAIAKLLDRNKDPVRARKSMASVVDSKAKSELDELKEMLAKGPPSARHHKPSGKTDRFYRTPPKTPDISKADDYMSAHIKMTRAATTNGDRKAWGNTDYRYGSDNFMMSHLKAVKDATPTKARPGVGKVSGDTYLQNHMKEVQAANGPQTFRSTKLVGSYAPAAKGVKGDSFLMQHLQQVEKEKKGEGVSSIGMTPHISGQTVQLEFLKQVAENRKKGESSVGVAPKVDGSSYMAAHAKKLGEEEKRAVESSIGLKVNLPVNNYLDVHLKEVTKLTHTAKDAKSKTPEKAAVLPADSFLESFHKQSRERHNSEPVPREREVRSEAANSFLLAHMSHVKAENTRPSSSTIGQKPSIDTEDFTMRAMRLAQKEVTQY